MLKSLRRLPVSRKKNALDHALLRTIATLRPAFGDRRVFERFERLVCGFLTAEERGTVTSMLEASGRTDCDWSGDYRVFSRDVWEPSDLFALLVPQILALSPMSPRAIVAALDDTNIRKSGSQIPGVAWRRDPMSPPFHANFIRAQRFIQTSVVVPFGPEASAARAIPVAFDHAPSAAKLATNASADEREQHREEKRLKALSTRAIAAIGRLRGVCDQTASDRRLLMTVDGSYTNGDVLKGLPDRTHLIGRIRKDARLHHPPDPAERRGRPCSYGAEVTPEQVRQDQNLPWTSVPVFAAGREHACGIKVITPLLWRKSGASFPLRLIVIRPLAYRRNKTARLLYRQPAYLITTDLDTPVEQLVQAYFWRWDIEVNHRDEKQLIGVGQAQVRALRSAERVPAFAVACYSMLLLSAAKAFGLAANTPILAPPKWMRSAARTATRISTRQMLRRLRLEHRAATWPPPNFDDFASNVSSHLKLPKSALTIDQALDYACN